MDLAMPYELGAKVHLLDRAAPFETYCYERQALVAYGDRGKTSADLSGLLDSNEDAPGQPDAINRCKFSPGKA